MLKKKFHEAKKLLEKLSHLDNLVDIIENYDVEFSIKVSSQHNHNLCYKKEDVLYLDKKEDKELIQYIKDKIKNNKIDTEKELERM